MNETIRSIHRRHSVRSFREDPVPPALLEAARRENALGRLRVLAGVEITHVRPEHFAETVRLARRMRSHVVRMGAETARRSLSSASSSRARSRRSSRRLT